jgi:hypothetical protein
MIALIRNWHQNLSWKLGYGHGKNNRVSSCPRWGDKTVYALAYMQGKGIEILSRETQLVELGKLKTRGSE